MVDVGDKSPTKRLAAAIATLWIPKKVMQAIQEEKVLKGNVMTTAKLAGIMAAKSTSSLIPLCHQILLSNVEISFKFFDLSSFLNSNCLPDEECFIKTYFDSIINNSNFKTDKIHCLASNYLFEEIKHRRKLINECAITILSEVSCEGRTGVEMEALVSATLASLTVYDMCKALSHNMVLNNVRLVFKKGGKTDFIQT